MNTIQGTIRQDLAKKIYDILNSDGNFAWFFRKKFSVSGDNATDVQFGAFSHILFDNGHINSDYFGNAIELANEILGQQNMEMRKLHRIYANLYLNVHHTDEMRLNEVHVDSQNEACKTILYYVNDSDGDTMFYDENKNIIETQSPKQGKYIIFNSIKLHGVGIPVKSKFRMVINIVFE